MQVKNDKRRQMHQWGQAGIVLPMVALALVAFIGFLGLVLDLGHLYVAKTELQNAADACALGAARELSTVSTDSVALTRAVNAGVTVGSNNDVDFQSAAVNVNPEDITFSDSLNGTYQDTNNVTASNVSYVKCQPRSKNPYSFGMWFMQILGIQSRTVSAYAVAKLIKAQTNCGLPIGICTSMLSRNSTVNGATVSDWGFQTGRWYSGLYQPGSGKTGNYGWLDFNPPNGGAQEIDNLLAGEGSCGASTGTQVGQTGVVNGVAAAWNTRFGIYASGYNLQASRPDWTGYSYVANKNWTVTTGVDQVTGENYIYGNAFADFQSERTAHTPYQGVNITGIPTKGNTASSSDLAQYGADRRLAVVPVLHCDDWINSQTAPIKDWACVLLLNPLAGDSGKANMPWMEFRGMADDPGSPCATSGVPSSGGGDGPLVATLVQ